MIAPAISMRQIDGLAMKNRPNRVASPKNHVSSSAPISWMMLPLRTRNRSRPMAIASATLTCRPISIRSDDSR